jgi:UDP-glucose 4-epimerase
VINIGAGVEVTINQLVDEIERVVGKQVHRIANQEESGGVSRLVADIALAADLLNWSPQVPLAEGLAAMVARDERFRLRKKVASS